MVKILYLYHCRTTLVAGSYPPTVLGLGVPYDDLHCVIFKKDNKIIATTNHMTFFSLQTLKRLKGRVVK